MQRRQWQQRCRGRPRDRDGGCGRPGTALRGRVRIRTSRRQDPGDGAADGGQLRDRHVDFDSGMEVDADDAIAGHRLRLDVFDIVHCGGDGAFGAGDDALVNVLGRHAGVVPDDARDRQVDLREDVGGHGENRQDAQNDDEHGHHDERVGPIECEFNDPHEE